MRVYRRRWRVRTTGELKASPFWCVSYVLPDGRKVDHLARPRTTHRKVAEEVLAREIAAGGRRRSPSADDVLEAYRKHLAAHAPSMLRAKEGWLDWWKERFGLRPADSVRRQDVSAAVLSLRGRGLRPGTVGSYERLLKSAFRRFLPEHELARLRIVDASPKRDVTWTKDELVAVISEVPPWVRDLLGLLLLTGLRLGDALKLRWAEVHDTHLEFLSQKPGRRIVVPLRADARAWLERMGDRKTSAIFVFPAPSGDPYSREAARKHFAAARRKLGLMSKHFHDIRRTFATALYEAGVSDEQIAGLLGQKSTTVVPLYRVAKFEPLARAAERALLPPVLPDLESTCENPRESAGEADQEAGRVLTFPEAIEVKLLE
jgi:integrase